MAQRPVRTPSVPDVSSGVEVSRVDSDLLSPLSLSYDSELPPLPESLSRLSLYDVPPRSKPEPARRHSPKSTELVGSPKQTRQSPIPSSEHSDKRPTEKPPVPPRKPSSVDLKLAHLRNEMASLRQMDLQLLSQLRQLNDSISSYRQELIMNMDSYSSSDTDGSDTTSVYSNVTPSSFDLSRSSTLSTPKRPPTSTDL
ncbi:leucine repeat adapter protein 25-like [Melanaphis sacchari]|uniref:leucine repeat adapter protein 25-like n=1 Tax=Melanaphis sacchari TaxID=742174 RepID=UPI000DC15979|nr:leucine repeat adapter protein 25-like [Melanaphis sacchari]